MPAQLLATAGTTADCTQALPLMGDLAAEYWLADRAYDTNVIVASAAERGMTPVIPSRKNRKAPRDWDRDLYQLRHLVENSFCEFKQWRGVATRYAKTIASYLAGCQIRALLIWAKLI